MLFGSDRMELLAYLLGKLQVHVKLSLTLASLTFITIDQKDRFTAKMFKAFPTTK